MVDLQSILASHHSRDFHGEGKNDKESTQEVTFSSIPDIFFDEILVNYKLNRVETLLLMFLYRQVWCRPNLHKKYGISPMLSHTQMGTLLNITLDEVYQALRKLESFGFIETIRSGQYFVRRFFTEEFDYRFGHSYEDS